jgi:nicotinamidase-related amidase
MKDYLIVVDMQNDFIDGSLGTKEAVAIVDKVADRIRRFDGEVIFTRDTHPENYLETQEGRILPVVHCVRGSAGWQIREGLESIRPCTVIDKPTFGSTELGVLLSRRDLEETIGSVTLVGLCTDICVISNALLIKAFLPETPIVVDAACCAGVTPESHRNALEAMKLCQITIENE